MTDHTYDVKKFYILGVLSSKIYITQKSDIKVFLKPLAQLGQGTKICIDVNDVTE